jgi:hypothetical protein
VVALILERDIRTLRQPKGRDTYGPSLGDAGAVGGVSAMGRRKPSDLAMPVRDKMARTAWACPADTGRASFQKDEGVGVPFGKGDGETAGAVPGATILGGDWLCSWAMDGQRWACTAGGMLQDPFLELICPCCLCGVRNERHTSRTIYPSLCGFDTGVQILRP